MKIPYIDEDLPMEATENKAVKEKFLWVILMGCKNFNQNNKFAFPQYVNQNSCSTNSASATSINGLIRFQQYVIHSFRHVLEID